LCPLVHHAGLTRNKYKFTGWCLFETPTISILKGGTQLKLNKQRIHYRESNIVSVSLFAQEEHSKKYDTNMVQIVQTEYRTGKNPLEPTNRKGKYVRCKASFLHLTDSC